MHMAFHYRRSITCRSYRQTENVKPYELNKFRSLLTFRKSFIPYLVHGPDPENFVAGTFWGSNFYHTFLESRHPALLEKSGYLVDTWLPLQRISPITLAL